MSNNVKGNRQVEECEKNGIEVFVFSSEVVTSVGVVLVERMGRNLDFRDQKKSWRASQESGVATKSQEF